jgi:3,4-dihydroxy 2-butanone 4-phosphate synthase/GTP cyclohydrolase II
MANQTLNIEPQIAGFPFTEIPIAIEEIRAGRMVVVVDDEDRENEGDLTIAAEKITPEAINFLATHGRGLICLAMTPERLDVLELRPMTRQNTARFGTAFTESIDALGRGVTTGISACDRAETILCAIDPATSPSDLGRPGHIFPLRAQTGGVLVRAGQTEASVDLARLAGLKPAGVICEIMKDDGAMARVPDLVEFCRAHSLKMISIAELIRYRMMNEKCVRRIGSALIPTAFGDFSAIAYGSDLDTESHVALVLGDVDHPEKPVMVRIHSHCFAGGILGASSCNCSFNLQSSLRRISQEGAGVVIYLHQNSNGFVAGNTDGTDTIQFHSNKNGAAAPERQRQDHREYGISAQILRDLNIQRVRLLADQSHPEVQLARYGVRVVERCTLSSADARVFALPAEEILATAY